MTIVNVFNEGVNSQEEYIEFNKILSGLKGEILKEKDFTDCIVCGKKNIRFCKSHTLPQLILKNFAIDGRLYNMHFFKNKRSVSEDNGIQNAQIFYSICPECDSKLFQDYENIVNYNDVPCEKMLKQIALKNHLYFSYKLNRDIKIHKYVNKILKKQYKFNKNGGFSNVIKCHMQDLIYHQKKIQEVYNTFNSKEEIYRVGFYKKLDYLAPIATQTCIGLNYDLIGRRINNPFSKRDLDQLYLCIFPFENSSIIFIFYEKQKHKYDKFFQLLNCYDDEKQLAMINYMLILYCEDIFVHRKININEEEKENIGKLSFSLPIARVSKKDGDKQKKIDFKNRYDLNRYKESINLLNKKYAIKPD